MFLSTAIHWVRSTQFNTQYQSPSVATKKFVNVAPHQPSQCWQAIQAILAMFSMAQLKQIIWIKLTETLGITETWWCFFFDWNCEGVWFRVWWVNIYLICILFCLNIKWVNAAATSALEIALQLHSFQSGSRKSSNALIYLYLYLIIIVIIIIICTDKRLGIVHFILKHMNRHKLKHKWWIVARNAIFKRSHVLLKYGNGIFFCTTYRLYIAINKI